MQHMSLTHLCTVTKILTVPLHTGGGFILRPSCACFQCPAMNIKILVKPGTAITKVDIMPMSAYAKAQNGRASGSLQHKPHCLSIISQSQSLLTTIRNRVLMLVALVAIPAAGSISQYTTQLLLHKSRFCKGDGICMW